MKNVPFPQLQAFLAVARTGSFAKAALDLGVSRSAVSQSVRQLEDHLRCVLVARTTRSVSLTDAGRRLVGTAAPAVAQIVAALTHASTQPGEVAGRLRLTVPPSAMLMVIDPVLRAFRERYPKVDVELGIEDRRVDIVAESYDAGVRLDEYVARDMVAVRLTAPFRFIVVGSPGYQGVTDVALAAPNVRAESCRAPLHTRIGWYRSVYNIFHAFAVGSFIDEIAHARGADPRDTWLDVIGPARKLSLGELGISKLPNYDESLDKHPVDAGRLRNVIERVTDMARWSSRNGRALGLAAHRSFVAYTAVVISVVPDPVHVFRIDDAWISMDSGIVVNKDRVHAQLEGGLIMGISNALYGGVTMTNGVTDQTNFRDARVARMRDVPRRIHTDVVASTEPPSGVGEPPVPPVSAALANAIFALTRKRLREIPLAKALKV